MAMWMKLGTVVVVVGLALEIRVSSVMGEVGEVDAAELVRKVRADEGWLHEVESFYLRAEVELLPGDVEQPVEIIERAWDRRRMYWRAESDSPNLNPLDLRIYDGERVVHRYGFHEADDVYVIADDPYKYLGQAFFLTLAWPRVMAHRGFWWVDEDRTVAAAHTELYGEPGDYRLVGREEFRGVDCHVVEGGHGDRLKLYIGTENHRLYGMRIQQLAEFWMLDWQEVAPGRFFPMRQGHTISAMPEDRPREPRRRELQITKVRVDEPLEDVLFEIEIPEGARVTDWRFDPLVLTYDQKADRTAEEWEEMLEEARRRQEEERRR
jgi:hypothetical protein